ncbi:MAG TPA: hypothetical protein VJ306_04360 [Pyrinomonadaceae bacterium]|nr:hypothetical protein [Pyrinomonadaceae bacterium]
MTRNQKLSLLLLVTLLPLGCRTKVETRNRFEENRFPSKVLWVWERSEDLEFLDPQQFAVAFLAQTLTLKNGDVVFSPRRQLLKVSPEVKLIAVTRIESQKTTGLPTALSAAQRNKLVDLVLRTLDLRNVSAVQIDFDAVVSEREFYRSLLTDLREKLPNNIPLSMTALASFCVGDRWLDDLPVDEAVPMIFRMGRDETVIKSFLKNGNDFREPLCRRSYGISVDEPIAMNFERRQYIFNVRAWTPNDVLTFQLK